MSDYLPGVPPEDQEKPPTPAEIERREREYLAAEVWTREGTESAVRKALKVRDNAMARVWINRGLERYWADRTDRLDAVRGARLQELEDVLRILRPLVQQGDLNAIDRYLKTGEMIRKLAGADVPTADEDKGMSITVNTGLPPQAMEIVDEAPEAKELGDGG